MTEAVLLAAWPAEHDDAFLAMVEALQDHDVPVWVCRAADPEVTANAEALVDGVLWLDCATDTVWMRDYGPIPVVEDGVRVLGDARYFGNRQGDDDVPLVLGELLGEEVVPVDLPLEGGNLLRDGGLCVAGSTIHSDHEWDAEEAAARLEVLGCEEVVWLDPLEGEPTEHIDVFSLLVDGFAVVTDDAAAEVLSEVIEVVEVDWDHNPVEGTWPSFTNALVLDEVALVPSYAGADTVGDWEALLPDREVVPIPADSLVAAGGAVHCVTRELTAVQAPEAPPEGCGCGAGGSRSALLILSLACACAGRRRPLSRRPGVPSCGSSAGREC
ncbi:MAG TPA: agmatine deiminase family protein [Myxococcota bacterium]|nr:agmatine deiminase family protein [Myxococcota bacterium]